MLPPGSKPALISFAVKDTAPYASRLKKANVNVRVGENFIRLSPSVYNEIGEDSVGRALAPGPENTNRKGNRSISWLRKGTNRGHRAVDLLERIVDVRRKT